MRKHYYNFLVFLVEMEYFKENTMLWKKILITVSQTSTRTLVVIPIFMSFIPIGVLLSLPGYYYSGTALQDNLIYSIFFLWGCSGIPIIIRGESPGSVASRGWVAYLQGCLMISIPWGIALVRIATKIFH
jgi:hypothetical protein